MTYTVKHSRSNPRNNSRVECETLDEARTEAAKYAGEDIASDILDGAGKCVAYRAQWETEVVDAADAVPDTLHLSDSADSVTADDLGITSAEYDRLCRESADSAQPEGHVLTSTGIRVYAL